MTDRQRFEECLTNVGIPFVVERDTRPNRIYDIDVMYIGEKALPDGSHTRLDDDNYYKYFFVGGELKVYFNLDGSFFKFAPTGWE